MKRVLCYLIWPFLLACSTTRNLPEEEVLYTGIGKIEVVQKDESREGEEVLDEIEAALSYPPNNALLGSSSVRTPLPFGLWAYNALVDKKGAVSRWLFDIFAAKPVFISTVNPEVRAKIAGNLLREYGYFRGESGFTIEPDPKNSRKARVNYRITMDKPYTYDSIAYEPSYHRFDTLFRMYPEQRVVKIGDPFNVVRLEEERQRISSLLRNNGYYYFRPEYISYQADTLQHPRHVALRVAVQQGLPDLTVRPWKIGRMSIALFGYKNEPPTDSIQYKNLTIRYEKKLRIRPKILYNRLKFRPGDLYSQSRQERTQAAFARLGIFRYSEMQYTPVDTSQLHNVLDLHINTVYDLPLDGELELNVTTKSNDQTGPGAVFSITKRNLFGGGETFGISMRGSYEWQTGKRLTGRSSLINSWEFGLSGTLTFPRLLFPSFGKENLNYPANTSFRIYANQLNRARFFRMLSFGGNVSYEFQPTATMHHLITPFKLTYSLLQHRTAEFDSITAGNPALGRSLENQFIPAIGYTYTYDDMPLSSRRHHLWWQASVTQAGLLMNSLYSISGRDFGILNKRFLGNRFAQFLKLTGEIRYNYDIGKQHRLVGRLMGGVAYAYGNANTVPYSEQFYIGGANSLRAFTIRSIGPGRFRPADSKYGYLDQAGDLKFEANLEYRFPLFGDLYGTVFLDAGNIWLLREDPNRPGGRLNGSDFLNDLALGTGVGFRYDLSFLVVRLDWGIGLHVPYDTGKKGYFNIPNFKDGMGIHLAVGYPF